MTPRIIPVPPLPVTLGDVVFTRWAGFSSRLTEWATNGRAAHQEQICCDGAEPKVMSASTLLNRMNVWTWESRVAYFEQTKTEWCRFTLTTMLEAHERKTLHNYFEEAKNSFNYSKAELLLQGLDSLRNWIMRIPYDSERAVWFRRAGNVIKSAVICSKIVNIGLIRIKLFPRWAEYWSPSDSLNKIMASGAWKLADASDGFFERTVAFKGLVVAAPAPTEMTPATPVDERPAVDPAGGYGGGGA